jgi:hypothetical protein
LANEANIRDGCKDTQIIKSGFFPQRFLQPSVASVVLTGFWLSEMSGFEGKLVVKKWNMQWEIRNFKLNEHENLLHTEVRC